jgi:hypothetical protein
MSEINTANPDEEVIVEIAKILKKTAPPPPTKR